MRQQHVMSENEKELLTILGNHPEMSMNQLLNCTPYKHVSSMVRRIEYLKAQNIVAGPVYSVDYGKLCKNTVHRLFCIVESTQNYETVLEYLKVIKPLIWAYPVLSSHKELLNVGFLSSNNAEVKALLQVLKDNDIITDYIIRARRHKKIFENPDFFGDAVPSLDTLLDPCDLPDITFGHHDIEWNACDIATLSYLQGGYTGIKLIEILRKEKKLYNREWTYEQVRYSYNKMVKNGLIEKIYYIAPFFLNQCADFYLFMKTDTMELTQRILYNFARGGRLYKEYTLCDDWGLVGCVSHPHFLTGLMNELDQIDEIEKKELYHVRSFPPGIRYMGEHAEFEHYDAGTQTLKFPYHMYREQIKERLDSELVT
jgi:hypothetical protein